jgi:Tfp pilus assembly protein PilN
MMKDLNRIRQKAFQFLQTYDTALGIDLCSGHFHFARIRRMPGSFKILAESDLPGDTGKSRAELLLSLPEIIRQQDLASTCTVLNIPRDMVLLKKLNIPVMPADEIKIFLYQNPELILTGNSDLSTFLLTPQVLEMNHDKMKLLVSIIRKEEIADIYNNLSPHLNCFDLGYQHLNLIQLIQTNFSHFSGRHVHADEEGFFVFEYEDGRLIDLHSGPGKFPAQYLTAAQSPEDNPENVPGLLISGNEEDEGMIEAELTGPDRTFLNDLFGLSETGSLSAFAAAVSSFQQPPNALDFSPDNQMINPEQKYYKQLALKTVLGMGGIMVFIYLLLFGLNLILSRQQTKQLEDFARVKPFLLKKTALQQEQQQLENIWQQYQFLHQQKSYFSYYVYRISGCLPDNAWLFECEISKENDQGHLIHLSGLALSEANLSSLLSNLENLPFHCEVQLEEMLVYDRSEVYKKWKLRYNNLVEFKVRVYV